MPTLSMANETMGTAAGETEAAGILKPRRCPRCGATPKLFTEVWTGHRIEFDVKPDGSPEDVGHLFDGHATHVIATCGACDWEWRLRGVSSIYDLRLDPVVQDAS